MKLTTVTTAILLIGVTNSGCGSQVSPPGFAPSKCNKTDRHGVYRFDFTTESGDCGMQTSGLVNFDDPGTGANCTTSGTTWSNGDCKLTTTVRCTATSNTPPTEATAATTQDAQDGSTLSGTMTIQVEGSHGCIGTYAIHATRQ